MRKRLIAAAAAAALAVGGAQADTGPAEPASFTRVVGWIVTAAGGVKALVEFYDWVVGRLFEPQYTAADLWLCMTCGFTPAGNPPIADDHVNGAVFIANAFPDRPWHKGQSVIVCDTFTCLMFTWNGSMFVPKGNTFKDPKAGYANKAPASHDGAARPPSVGTGLPPPWSPQHNIPPLEPPLPKGSVDVIWGDGIQVIRGSALCTGASQRGPNQGGAAHPACDP